MNQYLLSNGVNVILDHVESANSACIGFFVKAGSVDEDASNYGISHIIEHMMFKGTKTRTYQEISEAFDELGISINAFTGEEYTCYYAKSLPENLLKATELYSDMLMNSLFDENELKKELGVIIEEYKMYRNNPEERASQVFCNSFFNNSSYEVDIIGTEESILNTTREKIVDYVEKRYCNDNIIICVSGKFNKHEILSYLENNFNLNKNAVPRNIKTDFNSEKYISYVDEDTEQSYVNIGVHTFDKSDDRAYALMILSKLFGGSMSSRLFKSIREEQGLAYSVGSYAHLMAGTGAFLISAGVSNDKVEQAVVGIKNEIQKLKEEKFSEEEFKKAKNLLKSSLIYSYEGIHNRMVAIGSAKLLLNRDLDINTISDKIDVVTYENVLEVLDVISDYRNYSYGVYSNKKIDIESLIA